MENKQMWLLLNDLVDNTTKVSTLCPGDCPCFKLLEQAQQLIYKFIEKCYCIRKEKGFSKAEIKKRILAARKSELETDKEQNINTLLEVFEPQVIDCPRCQYIFKQLKGEQCTELEKYVLMDKMCTHCKIKLTSKLYRKSYEKLSAERHYGTLMSQVNDWSCKAEKFFERNRNFLSRTRSETGRGPMSVRSEPQFYDEYGLPSERGVGHAEGRDRYQRPMAGYPGQPRGHEPFGDEFVEDRYRRPKSDGYPGQPREDYYEGGRQKEISRFGAYPGRQEDFYDDRGRVAGAKPGFPGQAREDYDEDRGRAPRGRPGYPGQAREDYEEDGGRASRGRPGYPGQTREDYDEDRGRAPKGRPGYPGQAREDYDEDRGRAPRGRPGYPGQAQEDYDEDRGRAPRGRAGYPGQAREDYDEDRGRAPRGKPDFAGQAREDYDEDRGRAPRGRPGYPGQAREDYDEDRGRAPRGKPGFAGQAREDYDEDRGRAPRGRPGYPGQAREDYDEDRGRAPRGKPGFAGQAREDYDEDRGRAPKGRPGYPGQAREDYDEDRGRAPRGKPGFAGQAREDYDEDRGRAPRGKPGYPGQAREDYDEDRGRAPRGKPGFAGQAREDYDEDRGRPSRGRPGYPGQAREDYDDDKGRAPRGKPGQPREEYDVDRGRAPKAVRPGQPREDYDEDRGRAPKGKPGQAREDYDEDRSRAPKAARPGQPREDYDEDRGRAPKGKPGQAREDYDEDRSRVPKAARPGQPREDYDEDRGRAPKGKPGQAREDYDEDRSRAPKAARPGQPREDYDEDRGRAPKGKPGQAREDYDEDRAKGSKAKAGQAKEGYDEVKGQAPKGKPGQVKEDYDEDRAKGPKAKAGQAKEGYDEVKGQAPKGKPGQSKVDYDEDKGKAPKAKPGQVKEGYDEVKGQALKGKTGQAKDDYVEDKSKGPKAKAGQAKEDDGDTQKDKRQAVADRGDQDEDKGKQSKAKAGQAKEVQGGKLQKEKPDGRGDAEDKDRSQKVKPGEPDAAVIKQSTKEGQARKESLSKDKTGPGQPKPGKGAPDEGSKQVQEQKTKGADVSKKERQDGAKAKSEEGSKAKTGKIPLETADQKPGPGDKIKGLDTLRKQQEEEARSKKKEGQTTTDKNEKESKKDVPGTKDVTAPKGKEAPVSKTTGKIEPEPLAVTQKKIEDQKAKAVEAKTKGQQDGTKAKTVEDTTKGTKGSDKIRLVSSDEQEPVSKFKGQIPADKQKTPLSEPKSFEERMADMHKGPHITISKLLAIKQAERQKKEEQEPKPKATGKGGDQILGLSPENKEVMAKFLKMINDRQTEQDREKKIQELELQKLEALKESIITKGDVKVIKSRMTEMIKMKQTKFMLPFTLATDIKSPEITKSSSESFVPTVIYKGHVAKKNSDLEKEIERDQDQYLPYRVQSESCDISDFLLEAAKSPEDPSATVEQHKTKKVPVKEEKNSMGVRYALSDPKFIDIGWTKLPSMKLVRKVNVYQTTLAKPNFDWFIQNKNKGPIFYENGEKLADFIDNRGFWFYKNGKIALECHKSEEPNAKRRYTVYSNNNNTEKYPDTVLATFDQLGNGIIYDNVGNIRLKYNQYEGKLLDRSIGPETHWKWNSLNEPPDLQHVLVDMKLQYKDPRIVELDTHSRDLMFKDDSDMIAIETENQIKQMTKAASQDFRKYGVRMKTIKINDNFSLRMIDQSTIYLNFNEDSKRLKLHLGIVINHKEIVGTDTKEAGEMTNIEKLPAITESIAGIQRTIKNSNQKDQMLNEKMAWKRPRSPGEDQDRMLAAVSKPLRLPLIEEPKVDIEQLKQCYYHHCIKKNIGCKT